MTEPLPQKLHWLSACYFFFFAILGIMVPYLGVFFDHRGFDAQEIGLLLAILMATRIIAPNIWAFVADKSGKRTELIQWGAGAAALSYLSFFYEGGLVYMAASLAIYSFFWNAILAQLEVVTLETLSDKSYLYGRIRSWGSLGYIVLVIGAGYAITLYGPEVVPKIGLALFMGMFISSLLLPSDNNMRRSVANNKKLNISRPMIWFLISALFLQMSAGPFYGFFVLYLRDIGYSESIAGFYIALGVFAEIFMFAVTPRFLSKYGVKKLLITSVGFTVIRWLLLGVAAEQPLLLALSQILHAFTFGLTHAASIHFIHQQFDKHHRSQGQALYASLSFGVGGALGTWLCGIIWADGSGAFDAWMFAAACATISLAAVYLIREQTIIQ
ncbi:MFS transporter [Shewanella gelidii]|uniref:MFS transporter n=1 Tax=Shewanella gelidii TaxID=1642821 RepID=A0A917JSR2_9GAMM|nr:MFS transporter [Shewanella gelidii]MCL1098232.1 MFS transporter [Shewanella gelidii]GGI83593.1 MFS transporter [Shewanella gelidii]